ncbi:MAG: HEPN domain-containing protein [Bacteroidota bacterium]
MAEGISITAEVEDWIRKAEEDYYGARRLLQHTNPTEYSLVCFCAQQCAEKHLKAFLTAANQPFECKHQLEKLILPPCIKVDPTFEFIREYLRRLDAYGVDFRYPGNDANKEEATIALKTAEAVREFVRSKLGQENRETKEDDIRNQL